MFAGLSVIYFGTACYLALVANVVAGDAWSHVEIAQRVLFSRDPHLAAIGFVWSPLPVIVMLPLVPLKFLWPQLTTLGLAGGIVSATCMAGSAVQLRGMFSDVGLNRIVALLLTAAFAFHPLVFWFGANGMTEAMLLLFLLIALRYLARWLRVSDLNSLITAGIALALAYFSRYESLAAALGVIGVVAMISFQRARNPGGQLSSALCDIAIIAAPVAVAFLIWALASWLIVGHPFDILSSVYVNRTSPTGYTAWSGGLVELIATQLASLEPLLPVILVVLVFVLRRRGMSLALASVACLGSTLCFMVLEELSRGLTNELRYLIVVVPLTVILAGAAISSRMVSVKSRSPLTTAIALVCVFSIFASLPITARALLDPILNPYSATAARSIFSLPDSVRGGRLDWTTARAVAADLDQLHLRPGSVLVDDVLGFSIVASSSNPTQFVITSDRDFQSILAGPQGTGVQYILVPQPGGLANEDAVNRQYPGFFATGGGFASLVREYVKEGINDTTWRLYRIN